MNAAPDMRIPVVFGPAEQAGNDAWLLEGDRKAPKGAYAVRFSLAKPSPGHAGGCACCTPRGAIVTALGAMFRARATGEAPFFTRVIILAPPENIPGIRAALQQDLFTAARYQVD